MTYTFKATNKCFARMPELPSICHASGSCQGQLLQKTDRLEDQRGAGEWEGMTKETLRQFSGSQLFLTNETGFGLYCYFLTTDDEKLTFTSDLFSFLRLLFHVYWLSYYKPLIILFGLSYMHFYIICF